jgi:YegS/Rv2252/BmrU family lipid kinase
MCPKTLVIVNPESDRGRTKKRWTHINEALRAFFKEFDYEFTEKPFQAAEIARDAIKNGTELVIGIGGDGTLHEIANGFFENRVPINIDAALGIIPSGSGSDFSRSLHIPSDPHKALQVIAQSRSNLIDIGLARFYDHSGTEQERFFLNISDFGIGGEVVNRMNQRRAQGKPASYLKSLIATFIRYKNKQLKISIDGTELPEKEFMIGAIANGRIFGKGMKIAPEASLNDGLFDIVLIKGISLWEFGRNVRRIYTGSHLSHAKITLFRGKSIDVQPLDADKEVLIEMDGEQLGRLPATFDLCPLSIAVKGVLC